MILEQNFSGNVLQLNRTTECWTNLSYRVKVTNANDLFKPLELWNLPSNNGNTAQFLTKINAGVN